MVRRLGLSNSYVDLLNGSWKSWCSHLLGRLRNQVGSIGLAEAVQGKCRGLADTADRVGNPFRFAPVAPQHTGQLDYRHLLRQTLEKVRRKIVDRHLAIGCRQ